MAGSGSLNIVARRAIDEIADFTGEIETPKYMKAFKLQEISESNRLIRVFREEIHIAKTVLAQMNRMIAEMEAINDPDEYGVSIKILKESKRMGGWKIMGLNKRIEEIEEDIRSFERHIKLIDGAASYSK